MNYRVISTVAKFADENNQQSKLYGLFQWQQQYWVHDLEAGYLQYRKPSLEISRLS